jgi:hypothetical protein
VSLLIHLGENGLAPALLVSLFLYRGILLPASLLAWLTLRLCIALVIC